MSKAAETAQALIEKNDLKGAMKAVNDGLNKDPNDMALIMMGSSVVSRENCWGMAYNLMKYVKANSPPFPEIYNNLGMAAANLSSMTGDEKLLDEAEMYLRKAYYKSPVVQIIANLATLMIQKGQIQEGEKFAREALALDPGNTSARETLGYSCLHQAKWYEGFGNYEFTLGGKYRVPPKGEYWERGMKGKNLLVVGEQGIGDEISYSSVIPDASKDNQITYECDHRLKGLMQRSFPNVEVHGTRFHLEKDWKEDRDFDATALTGSLCMQYRQRDEDFPRSAFLVADPERKVQWRALLSTLPGRKVGIAWTGGRDNTYRARRSFNLEGLLPILKIPGITWVSLQYKDPTDEIEAFTKKHGIEIKHWKRATDKDGDYDETAALVSELDCVVSVTTAVVHLCGGLGKKCYVLVPKRCRWFYQSDDSRHRWYDSLELFKQQDKWPVERLADKLKADLCA